MGLLCFDLLRSMSNYIASVNPFMHIKISATVRNCKVDGGHGADVLLMGFKCLVSVDTLACLVPEFVLWALNGQIAV